jgi:DNA polymerase III delta prime subunit
VVCSKTELPLILNLEEIIMNIFDNIVEAVEKVTDDVVDAVTDISEGDIIGAIENVVDAVETVKNIEEKI